MSKSKKTLTSSQSFTDVMVISGGHSLMVSHVPEKVASGSLSDNFYKATKRIRSLLRDSVCGEVLSILIHSLPR